MFDFVRIQLFVFMSFLFMYTTVNYGAITSLVWNINFRFTKNHTYRY